MKILLCSLIIIVSLQLIAFLYAYTHKTDKVTDLTYSVTFAFLAIFSIIQSNNFESYNLLLGAMIVLWALRLGSYLFIRIHKIKKDKRFDEMRNSFWKFGGFWTLQTLTIWVVMLPAIVVLSQKESISLATTTFIGLALWIIGFVIESIADHQKFIFKSDSKNKGDFISSGLWKYSRHPNYFGEILCWTGVFIYCIPALQGIEFLSIISPIFIFLLLCFVSGIPLLEKKYDERYADNKQYQSYKKNTSILVPLPKK